MTQKWTNGTLAVLTFPIPQEVQHFLLTEEILASEDGTCFMELISSCVERTEIPGFKTSGNFRYS